jgi:hypothetical protein
MEPFRKLEGFRRSAPGLEWTVLQRLPLLTLVGALVPVVAAVAAHLLPWPVEETTLAKILDVADAYAAGAVIAHFSLVLACALACIIVVIMKGPAYVADAYELPDSDAPR